MNVRKCTGKCLGPQQEDHRSFVQGRCSALLPLSDSPGQDLFSGEGDVSCNAKQGGRTAIYQDILQQSLKAFLAVLDGYTLADLITHREQLSQLLGLDQPVNHDPPVHQLTG